MTNVPVTIVTTTEVINCTSLMLFLYFVILTIIYYHFVITWDSLLIVIVAILLLLSHYSLSSSSLKACQPVSFLSQSFPPWGLYAFLQLEEMEMGLRPQVPSGKKNWQAASSSPLDKWDTVVEPTEWFLRNQRDGKVGGAWGWCTTR